MQINPNLWQLCSNLSTALPEWGRIFDVIEPGLRIKKRKPDMGSISGFAGEEHLREVLKDSSSQPDSPIVFGELGPRSESTHYSVRVNPNGQVSIYDNTSHSRNRLLEFDSSVHVDELSLIFDVSVGKYYNRAGAKKKGTSLRSKIVSHEQRMQPLRELFGDNFMMIYVTLVDSFEAVQRAIRKQANSNAYAVALATTRDEFRVGVKDQCDSREIPCTTTPIGIAV